MGGGTALGGTIVMDGFPLPPLCDMPGHAQSDARNNATYYGTDMRWMIYWGAADPIFPAHLSLTAWNGVLNALGLAHVVNPMNCQLPMGLTAGLDWLCNRSFEVTDGFTIPFIRLHNCSLSNLPSLVTPQRPTLSAWQFPGTSPHQVQADRLEHLQTFHQTARRACDCLCTCD